MARLPRLVVPGLPHHLIQRALPGITVFQDDLDRRHYLDALFTASRDLGVVVHAYVLMPDHVHLLVTPGEAAAMGTMMQRLGRRYVSAFNTRHHHQGTVWEGRYRATVLEPQAFLVPCMVYLEANPVRAGLVELAQDWPWSSAAHHLGRRRDVRLTDHAVYWALGNTPFEREAAYRRLLEQGLGAAQAAHLVEATLKGWALGSPAFLAELQQAGARRPGPLPRGRPLTTPVFSAPD